MHCLRSGAFDFESVTISVRLYFNTLLPTTVHLDGAFEPQIWPGEEFERKKIKCPGYASGLRKGC
jgi:hypothetical protein